MFQDKMVTPAIPERVFTLCRIVAEKANTEAELREKMEPAYLSQTTSYFADYRTAAEELGLISTADRVVSLAVDPSAVASMDSMRRYVNAHLEEFSAGQFYRVTQAYFAWDAQVLHGKKSLVELAEPLAKAIGRPVDPMEMRAWRFWVSYLGFGCLHEMFFLPNADVFLHDVIRIAGLETGRAYSFGEFIDAILPYSRVIVDDDPAQRRLNYGVSNGLRTLHDIGVVRLEHILDQEDIWSLYPLKAHPITETVTNITICG